VALQVGELNAILTIDDRAVDPALRRAEDALRQSGRRMGQDAEDEGEQAGRLLGQGLVRGADGQWRNMRGELVDEVTAAAAEAEAEARRAGQRIGQRIEDGADEGGQAAGDAIADGVGEGADEAVTQAGSRMERLKQVAKGAALAAGAAAGAALIGAMSDAMDQSRIAGRLGAQLGATPAEAQRYGKLAGALYADAVTEDFQGAADAISAVMRAGIAPPGATNAQLKSIATNVSDLASTFELDLGQTANAVGQAIKTGLAKDGREAIDVFTVGLQKMGPRADDLMDTFNEYSVQFQRLGLDAKTATGLLSQGMKAGARDTDVVADALKEFTLEGVMGSDKIVKGFQAIGLNADDMVKKISKGGPDATEALQMTLDTLRKMEDPVKRDAAAAELFGTKSEDMQKALLALDPSTAVDALGKVGGAADRMGNTLRDNAGTRVEQFKRGLQQGLVNFLGGPVLGSLEGFKKKLSGLWDNVTKGMDGASMGAKIAAFIPALGGAIAEKAVELGPKIAQALSDAGQRAAEWVMANPAATFKIAAIAGAFLLALAFLPELLIGGLALTAGLVIGGFIARLVQATEEKLPEWWQSFTGWVAAKAGQVDNVMNTVGSAIGRWFSGLWSRYVGGPVSRAWASFIASVQALPGRASAALAGLAVAIVARAAAAWQSFRDTTVKRALALVDWVRGLPGRISKGIGSLNQLLVSKGRAVVQGLWSGIQSMGGWIKDRIIGWAKSVIPGPIAKALGIASPSKVTTAQGRWIARGLVDGLTGSSKQVRAASYKLVDIIKDSLTGKRRTKALKKINRDAGWLDWLAQRETKVAAKLKDATKKMEDLRKARTKLADDVKKGILGDADITKQDTGGWPQTAETILAGLKQDTAAAQTFTKHLATLRKKGVRSDLIAQIAQAGVSGGSAAAAALANANSGQIKQINAQQKLLVGAAGQAGDTAGNAMYQAGIAAAQGLVKGLRAQQKTIENTMLRMAKGLSKAMRKALGIKSPSRVMAVIGQYTAQGLIKGVEGQRAAVNRSMASLVETPAPGSWDLASGRARADAARRVVLELRSSGRSADDFVMESMRRGVRKKGGGDVDLVIAGRRGG